MLQVNDRQNADKQIYGPAEESSFPELIDFFRGVLSQQFVVILLAMVLAIGAGALYIYLTPPTFTARATLIIDRGKLQAQLGGMSRELPLDAVEVENQALLIQSENVGLAVIRKLDLDKDPEFTAPPMGAGGWLNELRARAFSGGKSTVESDPVRAALATLEQRLTVNRVGRNVLEIEVRSLKPERSAEIANAFADSYVEDQLNSRHVAARQAAVWLQERIQELGSQISQADESVEKFKAKNNLVTVGGKLINDQMLAELNTQLVLARDRATEARARLDRIEAVLKADSPNKQGVGTVSETLNNPVIVKLRSQYLELINREADWSSRFGKDHQAATNLRRQIREVRASIADELGRIAETYRSDYEIAKQRLAEIEKTVTAAVSQFRQANQAQIELRQLESSAETYRGLYKSALQRNTELVQQQSFPGTEARLVARAATPVSKSSPKTLMVLLGSAAGGMMLGLGLGVVRASLDRVFRTSGQVEAALQTNCLALTPVLPPVKVSGSSAPSGARTIVRDTNVIWEVVARPLSRFAEGMRSVKLAADLGGRSTKVLGVTSSLPNEGKSTIAAAFALLLAQTGARTILLDCDLRHPALSAALAPRAEHGLLDLISGKKQFDDVLWKEPTTKLYFLPGSAKPLTVHSSEVLSSAALRTLFAELRQKYDYVIVDLPPLAPIVDVRSTSGLVDSYVFVVEWASTKIGIAELALRKAPEVQESLLGVVLNKVDFKVLRRHEGHRSDYYSNKHYAQYGIE